MHQLLKEALTEYKTFTIKLIESLEKDNFNSLEIILSHRQSSIDSMNLMKYTKSEFVEVCDSLDIVNLEQKCSDLLQKKRDEAKNNIDKFSEAKSANRSYRSSFSVDSLFFNKKI